MQRARCLGALSLLALSGCGESWERVAEVPFPDSHQPGEAARIAPETCQVCHPEVYTDWADSHHALANRQVQLAADSPAFQPPRTVPVGSSQFQLSLSAGQPHVRYRAPDGTVLHKPAVGVIGVEPLRQYLVPFAGGRWQVTSVAYDPQRDDWFYVFGDDVRLPGEWGHWTGQGMNWNANCAYCHMTDFHKNLTPETGHYASTWMAQGITCAQCHTELPAHVASARRGQPTATGTLTTQLSQESCATCHARREELTPELFRPGDLFNDHYRVALPDQAGLYHPDGQVNDENFVYGSMLLNRMGHAGIACGDCHTPHQTGLKLPVENNALCLSCHSTGDRGATRIEPLAHSHHPEGSEGNRCTSCHMPVNPFMQRDPRADHIFNSPDPLLTQEMGVPNTCNACHQDQSVAWAVEWTDRWYGADRNELVRARARLIHAYWNEGLNNPTKLLELARTDQPVGWRAALTNMLAPWASVPVVQAYLREALKDPEALVRSAAVRSLTGTPGAEDWLRPLLADPVRLVRLDAALAFPSSALTTAQRSELDAYLLTNSDRPVGALRVAQRDLERGDRDAVRRWVRRAIGLDQDQPQWAIDGAVLLARAGDLPAALTTLRETSTQHPEDPAVWYSLGLLEAERGELAAAGAALGRSVELEPANPRAWLNLALVRDQQKDVEGALAAVEKALEHDPWNARALQAKISFLMRLGRRAEAQELIRSLQQLSQPPGPQP